MIVKFWISSLELFLIVNYLSVAVHCEVLCKDTVHGMIFEKKGIIYWNNILENEFLERYETVSKTLHLNLNGLVLTELKHGCGRMGNRLGLLSDGSKICIRYRTNSEQIQGELFSYHLSKLLGIRNVLESKLLLINDTDEFWGHIDIKENSWNNMKVVTATKFIEDSLPVHLPAAILGGNFKIGLNTSFCGLSQEITTRTRMFLLQWSDMVIFDYLIGNFDRVVSNMFNLQWYSRSLQDPIENLMQLSNGILLFIDNEEGFSHGYRLLQRYEMYQLKLIENMCIFRQETLESLLFLDQLSTTELQRKLWHSILQSYKDSKILDYMTRMSQHNISILKKRINLIKMFVLKCKEKME